MSFSETGLICREWWLWLYTRSMLRHFYLQICARDILFPDRKNNANIHTYMYILREMCNVIVWGIWHNFHSKIRAFKYGWGDYFIGLAVHAWHTCESPSQDEAFEFFPYRKRRYGVSFLIYDALLCSSSQIKNCQFDPSRLLPKINTLIFRCNEKIIFQDNFYDFKSIKDICLFQDFS